MSKRHPQRKNRFKPKKAVQLTREELVQMLEATKPEWTPFKRIPKAVSKQVGADEAWENSRYCVFVYLPGNEKSPNDWNRMAGKENTFPRFVHLSIKTHDRCHTGHDWRDLQRIKNELCSPEAEAIEIYPAMSRLIDTSNQYHLWVMMDGDDYSQIPTGYTTAEIVHKDLAEEMFPKCVQRDFEDGFLEGYEETVETREKFYETIKQIKASDTPIAKALKHAIERGDVKNDGEPPQ